MPELVVEVVRSGFVECVHRVRVHVVDAQGAPVMVRGDTAALASPRSAMKPLQALAMLRHGLPLTGELLALAC
ncbi:MAG: asparaginase, partial [Thermobispora bispora]|nr:asparaginase [Thermobispora bispora]